MTSFLLAGTLLLALGFAAAKNAVIGGGGENENLNGGHDTQHFIRRQHWPPQPEPETLG